MTDPKNDAGELTWMITGANGNLGRRLIGALLAAPQHRVCAVVRSAKAQQAVEALPLDNAQRQRLNISVLSYTDVAALRNAAQGCNKVVHLVGILKETAQATYEDAHENSTGALLEALAQTSVDHLTYLSIVGSTPQAANTCLASKGRAEALCRDNSLATCVLRVPMVLGEGDYASYALKSRASKAFSFTFRADSMEQPIYAGDVVAAIVAAGQRRVDASLDLAGPEALTRRELTHRAGAVLGQSPRVISLPIGLGYVFASLLEKLSPNPPVTRTMLEVLDHDDAIAPQAALEALGLSSVTQLDDALAAVLK